MRVPVPNYFFKQIEEPVNRLSCLLGHRNHPNEGGRYVLDSDGGIARLLLAPTPTGATNNEREVPTLKEDTQISLRLPVSTIMHVTCAIAAETSIDFHSHLSHGKIGSRGFGIVAIRMRVCWVFLVRHPPCAFNWQIP